MVKCAKIPTFPLHHLGAPSTLKARGCYNVLDVFQWELEGKYSILTASICLWLKNLSGGAAIIILLKGKLNSFFFLHMFRFIVI